MRRLLIATVLAGSLYAGEPRIDGPVLGYVFDEKTRVVRAILGIPGSSRFSEPMPMGEISLDKAWIAPGRSYAIAVRADRKVERLDLLTGKATEIEGDVPDQVVWSAKGSAAALLYRQGRIRVFTNLDSSPEAGIDASAGTGLPAAAVSDDGLVVLAIGRAEQGTTLTAFREGGEERLLLTAPDLNRVAFLNGSRDAIVSDAAERKLYLLRDAVELSILAYVDDPSAIAVEADNSRVFIASKNLARIAAIGIKDGVLKSFDCNCAPEAFDRLQGSVFRISGLSEAPVWLFNGNAAENPFTFVPQPEERDE